jgi:TolB-like protein
VGAVKTPPGPAAEQPKSIAVLPFVNMSDDPGNQFFSDGISEELLNVLVKVPDLGVASRTSSFAYKGKEMGAAEIARELKVSYILEGSVRKAGDKVRITAQLIDAAQDRHIWSETYDRQLTDISRHPGRDR